MHEQLPLQKNNYKHFLQKERIAMQKKAMLRADRKKALQGEKKVAGFDHNYTAPLKIRHAAL